MLTKIPFYRDVIISSFQCEHCHFKNTGIDSANRIQENGVRINLTVETELDLNRELVKSDYATLSIPELDFEIPALNQKGCELNDCGYFEISYLGLFLKYYYLYIGLTTVEGVIDRVIENIQNDIELRKVIKIFLID
jgi:C4-type Zn-finger protein